MAVAQNNAVYVGGRVFGGGNLAPVGGNTEVTAKQIGSVVEGDIYGGGAFADVGTNNNNTTTVNIFEGTFNSDIYGGALGRKASEGVTEVAAAVNGVVTVKIGDGVVNPETNLATSVSHNPIIGGNVYGCNNANGTPKDDVTVHVFKTAHTPTDIADYFDSDADYAIDSVFGGGNKAHYQPITMNKKATVHVYTCDNTIQKVYGGGNAADVGTDGENSIKSATNVIIDGGRIEWVFGGGNGSGNNEDPEAPDYNPGANVFNDVSVTFRAGDIKYFFGGSNQKGEIPGSRTISILNDVTNCFANDRINHIEQLYGGNNLAASTSPNSHITLNMPCTASAYKIDSLFGGSRKADFAGNITLNVNGGEYDYIFGGNNIDGIVGGNVTLNLFGGTINGAAFGGNNAGGNINGKITVNLLEQSCPLVVHNIYGGGLLAAYTPTTLGVYPEVNLIHGTVSKKADGTGGNVFGGGLGNTAIVASSPVVNVGYDNVSMATLIPTLIPEGTTLTTANVDVKGDVYGGGEMAAVEGSIAVNVRKVSGEGLTTSTYVRGDVYGGGALADVNVTYNESNEPIYNDGTTTSVTLSGGTVGNIYGGGLGRQQGQGVSAVEAMVYGPVQVTVTGGTVTNSVYGCNNLNGAPQSTVNVDIYGTDPAPQGNNYAIQAVYGGGNQANYADEPVVVIHNCGNSIRYVYGGGNAASVTGTDVTVYGGNTIGEVYGGCYGADVTTDGTDVKIRGGKIGKVFGGNNASGAVTGAILVDVNKGGDNDTHGTSTACDMIIGEVYGGGNHAASEAGTITIGCTGTLTANHSAHPEYIGKTLEGIGVLYGGANQANITNGTITLNINSGIIDTIFGGNNISGSIAADIHVNINKNESETAVCPDDWYVGDVYGGGNHADCDRTPDVNIMAGLVSGNVYGGGNDITNGAFGVAGSDVVMTGGNVLGGIYGGCNLRGTVTGDSHVKVTGGVIGTADQLADSIVANVFGGGLGADTRVKGDVFVTIDTTSTTSPTIYGDVYGGSALGQVNNDGEGKKTIVEIFGGTLKTRWTYGISHEGLPVNIFTGGNVYGGGLGDKDDLGEGHTDIEAKSFGKVYVYIGTGTLGQTNPDLDEVTAIRGDAVIEGNIYGCNNVNGSPQDSVFVKVFKTAHTDGTGGTVNNTVGGTAYALHDVFGGGNKADFCVEGKAATVYIYTCENTIERTFSGGNAAATNSVRTMIQGGRIREVYGGGNGEVNPANVNGTATLDMHGGEILQSYAGSNQQGVISGGSQVHADDLGPCEDTNVTEFFCGGNFANYEGDIDATITCNGRMAVNNLYGGCNQALVLGNIRLTVYGGTYDTIYGGSKGRPDMSADVHGDITLNIFGGSVNQAIFGGCNVKGMVKGKIVVNVEEKPDSECPLGISEADIYGGGNKADYDTTPTEIYLDSHPDYPQINIRNAVVRNVFGGGYAAEVKGNPQVRIKKGSMVLGNVYGGGNMGVVDGNPRVIINGKDESENPTGL